jgi:hypothetical protein
MRRTRLLLAVLGTLGTLGCAGVQPHQRGQLARIERCQARDNASRLYESHLWMVREGAIGGTGRPGGGCGCN